MIRKDKYKFVLQKYDYDCGVAASATLLINSGMQPPDYEKLGKRLGLVKSGVVSGKVVDYFLKITRLEPKFKLNANINDLKKELAGNRLCMVVYQSWGTAGQIENLECGHYSVAVGIEDNKLYLLDPTAYEDWGDGIGWRIMDLTDFASKWVDREYSKEVRGWMLSLRSGKIFA